MTLSMKLPPLFLSPYECIYVYKHEKKKRANWESTGLIILWSCLGINNTALSFERTLCKCSSRKRTLSQIFKPTIWPHHKNLLWNSQKSKNSKLTHKSNLLCYLIHVQRLFLDPICWSREIFLFIFNSHKFPYWALIRTFCFANISALVLASAHWFLSCDVMRMCIIM